jgi:dTDP-4-dehydrorhamnose reductase
MRPRVLITGGSGLLALNWAVAMRDRYEIALGLNERSVSLPGVTASRVSLESVDALRADFERLEPQIVIHTAGLTNVEKCESNELLAKHVNVVLAENVAKTCDSLGLALVHISTDHLFSGDAFYVSEDQHVQPVNAYARTKAEAEVRVLEAYPQTLVVRTNFYGWGPHYRQSFSDMIVTALRSQKNLTLFQDVYFTPIIATELARITHDLLDLNVVGVCNVVGDERISKYEFGKRLAGHFNLNPDLILPGLFSERTSLVQRPVDMSLSSDKVNKLLSTKIGGVDRHISILKDQDGTRWVKEMQCL